MSMLANYAIAIAVIRKALLYGGAVIAAICAFDWAVRTRRINPFNRVARFFRGSIEPAMAPVERMVVRAGGVPSSAPLWTLVAYAVFGIALIQLLEFFAQIFYQLVVVSRQPSQIGLLAASWAFGILKLALIVRVLSSWFPISPYSKWIRWSYVLTDWLIRPLRRVIPTLGMIDITPIIAWFLIALIQRFLGVP
jgi:YggT family protein